MKKNKKLKENTNMQMTLERRQKKNYTKREFIDWLESLDDLAFTRQWEKIRIHIILTPENIAWNEAKEDYNVVAKRRGFDTIE